MHERIQNILDDIEKSGEKVRNINVFLNDPGTTVVINYSKGEGRQTEPIDLVKRDQLDQTLNTLAARDRVEGSGVPQQDRNHKPTDSGHVSPNLQNPGPLQASDEHTGNDEEDCDCDDDDDNDDNEGGGEEEKEEECDSAAAASDDDNDDGDDDGDGDDDNDGDGDDAKNKYAVPPQKPLHTADDDDNGDDVEIEFDDDDACHQDDDDDDVEEKDALRQRTIAAAHNSDVSRLRDDNNCDNDEEEENVVEDEDDYGDNDEEENVTNYKDDYGDDEKEEEKENMGKDKDDVCDEEEEKNVVEEEDECFGDDEEEENVVEDEDDYADNDEEANDKDVYGDDDEEKENVGKDKDEFCDDDDKEEENVVEEEDDYGEEEEKNVVESEDDDDENDEEEDDDEDDGDAAVNNDEHGLSRQNAEQRGSPNVATRRQIYNFKRLGPKQVAQIWKLKFKTVASQRERSSDKRYQQSQKQAARGSSISEERHSCSSGEANEQSTRPTKHTPFNTKTTIVEETSDDDESRYLGKDSESSERAKESEPEHLDKNSKEYIRDVLYGIKTECTKEEFAHKIRDPTRNKEVHRVVQSKCQYTYPDARDLYFSCVYDDIIVAIPYTKRSDCLYYGKYCKLYGSWWHHAHKTEGRVIDSTHPLYARIKEKATASVDVSLLSCQAYHPLP